MWTRTHSRSTTTAPDLLWRVVADVAAWGTWNTGIESITVHGEPAVGATFDMTPPGEDTVTSTIVELDPPRVLTDLTELDGVSVRVEHRVSPEPDGTSTLSFAITVSGEVPEAVQAEIGAGVSSDFDEVIESLVRRAQALAEGDPGARSRERP